MLFYFNFFSISFFTLSFHGPLKVSLLIQNSHIIRANRFSKTSLLIGTLSWYFLDNFFI